MPVQSQEVEGLEGLLSATLSIVHALPEGAFLWYRGHSKKSYTLLPGLLREKKSSVEVFDREKRLITRFRQRSLPFWPAGYPQNDWEHLFAMQHYGVPTRLLDWSENLFVAAHFALQGATDEADPPVIWCMDPISWNRATPALSQYGAEIHVLTTSDDESEAYRPGTPRRRLKSPVSIFGTHNSNRIVAQRGTFMVWGEEVKSLENFAEESTSTIYSFEIKGKIKSLKSDLNALGFGETMIIPELGSLAAELSRIEGWRSAQ